MADVVHARIRAFVLEEDGPESVNDFETLSFTNY